MRFILFISCLLAWVLATFAAPMIDQEDTFSAGNPFLQRFASDGNYFLVLNDHGSIKRGLGPRPLRFG